MKIKVLTLVLAISHLTLVAMLLVNDATANPYFPKGSWSDEPLPPVISVQSPSEKLNYWIGNDVWLDFTVTVPKTSWYSENKEFFGGHIGTTFETITGVRFSLNGMQEIEAAKVSQHQGVLTYSVNLGRLPFGKNTVAIHAEGSAHYGTLTRENGVQDTKTKLVESSTTINFVVDGVRPTAAPSVSLISPANTTYYWIMNWTHIPYVWLTYSADDTRLSVGYSFDGENNVTPAKNGTNLNIPIQSRSLTLYATDAFGNKATPQTVYYEIIRDPRAQSEPQPFSRPSRIAQPNINSESTRDFTFVIIAAGSAMVAVIASAGLLVYFNKRKRKKS